MIKPEHLDGWTVPGIFIALSAVGLWVFQEGFVKLRRKKKVVPGMTPPQMVPQQPPKYSSPDEIPTPPIEAMMDTQVQSPVEAPPQPTMPPIPQQPAPPPAAVNQGRGIDQPSPKGEDIFSDFK